MPVTAIVPSTKRLARDTSGLADREKWAWYDRLTHSLARASTRLDRFRRLAATRLSTVIQKMSFAHRGAHRLATARRRVATRLDITMLRSREPTRAKPAGRLQCSMA
jgi:chromosome condensin MukBEF complex kleisin-like MukF subunit